MSVDEMLELWRLLQAQHSITNVLRWQYTLLERGGDRVLVEALLAARSGRLDDQVAHEDEIRAWQGRVAELELENATLHEPRVVERVVEVEKLVEVPTRRKLFGLF